MHYYLDKIFKKVLGIIARNATGIITRVNTKERLVSLTFDDGPDPVFTLKVLEVLKQFGAHATFFMVGESAQNYPDIVKRVYREGHTIGNHSWNHSAFPLIPLAQRWEQIRRCQQVIRPHGQRLFRPPYGLNNVTTNTEVLLQGFKVIGWSLSSEDWHESDSEMMLESLEKKIRPGDIVLFHDSLFHAGEPIKGPKLNNEPVINREPMLSALSELLGRLNGNVQFVTVPVLLRSGRAYREAW